MNVADQYKRILELVQSYGIHNAGVSMSLQKVF